MVNAAFFENQTSIKVAHSKFSHYGLSQSCTKHVLLCFYVMLQPITAENVSGPELGPGPGPGPVLGPGPVPGPVPVLVPVICGLDDCFRSRSPSFLVPMNGPGPSPV